MRSLRMYNNITCTFLVLLPRLIVYGFIPLVVVCGRWKNIINDTRSIKPERSAGVHGMASGRPPTLATTSRTEIGRHRRYTIRRIDRDEDRPE